MLKTKYINTIESLKWESVGEGRCKCIGMRTFSEIFSELETRLKGENMLPDEYFLSGNTEPEHPENVRDVVYNCHVDFGSNEGIYLDIVAQIRFADNSFKRISFATGKTLSEDAAAFRHMGIIAAECSMLLNGDGCKVRDGCMTNKVYATPYSERPMSPKELLYALGFDSHKYFGKISENEMLERISGNHCRCNENEGEFILLPLNNDDVVNGMKRYMRCRKCGDYSHL